MDDNSWISDLDAFIKEHGEPATNELFPNEVSEEEAKGGFFKSAIPSPGGYAFEPSHTYAVLKHLGNGVIAIKTAAPTGAITYAIWKDGRPVGFPVATVRELETPFPKN